MVGYLVTTRVCVLVGLKALSSHQGSHVGVIDRYKQKATMVADRHPLWKFYQHHKKKKKKKMNSCIGSSLLPTRCMEAWDCLGGTARAKGGRVRSSGSSSLARSSIDLQFEDIALNRSGSFLCGRVINGKLRENDRALFLTREGWDTVTRSLCSFRFWPTDFGRRALAADLQFSLASLSTYPSVIDVSNQT